MANLRRIALIRSTTHRVKSGIKGEESQRILTPENIELKVLSPSTMPLSAPMDRPTVFLRVPKSQLSFSLIRNALQGGGYDLDRCYVAVTDELVLDEAEDPEVWIRNPAGGDIKKYRATPITVRLEALAESPIGRSDSGETCSLYLFDLSKPYGRNSCPADYRVPLKTPEDSSRIMENNGSNWRHILGA